MEYKTKRSMGCMPGWKEFRVKKTFAALLALILLGTVGCQSAEEPVEKESALSEETTETMPTEETEAVTEEPVGPTIEEMLTEWRAESERVHIIDCEDAVSKYFIGRTDKPSLEYKVGDTMTMDIVLVADDAIVSCDYFYYTITSDWGYVKAGEVPGDTGELTLSVDCEEAGGIRVQVSARDEMGFQCEGVDTFEGGVLVNFDDIVSAVSEPEDFDEFWAGELDRLFAIEPTAIKAEKLTGTDGVEGFDVFDMTINMGEGDPVRAYLSYPTGAEVGSLKGKLVFYGYGVYAPLKICQNDCIVMSVCAHSIDLNGDAGYYNDLFGGALKEYGFDAEENQSPATCYFRGMALRDVQAARYLMTMAQWNGRDLEVEGESQGGFQSAMVAALLGDKITKCSLRIPWMCDIGGDTIGRIDGWQPEFVDGLRYFDTVSFARRITCDTTIYAGLGDYVCPPSGIAALYNEMTCPVELTFAQNGTHGYRGPNSDMYTKAK